MAAGQECVDCGRPLKRDNTGDRCQACVSAACSSDHNRRHGDDGGNLIDGARLAQLRRERGLTQQLLAERAGLSIVIVRKLEQNARRSARVSTVAALAAVLDVPVGLLLGGDTGGQGQELVRQEDDGLEDMPGRPTLMRVLIAERHWQRFKTFELHFRRAAQDLARREGDPELAKLTVSSRQWERWYSGRVKTEPFPDACRVLEHMFGYSVRQLLSDWEPVSNDGGKGEGISEEPEPGATLGVLGTARHVEETTEDVVDVLSRIQKLHRSTIQPDIICQLQDAARETVAQYETFDHASLVPALIKKRVFLEVLLSECSHPVQQRQLFEVTAAISGVLGYVAVGRGDFSLARAYTLEAFQLGDFAGDANLRAWARGLQSFCEYYAGRYAEAVSLAQDGLRHARSGPQSVRLTINGVARAKGKLGDAEGVHRAVGEAHDLLSLNDVPDGVPSSIALECYSLAQTASNAATAYVSMGMTEKVQHYVNLALPEISKSDSPWSRSLVMIDLARSLIRSEKSADLDRAVQLVLEALSISSG